MTIRDPWRVFALGALASRRSSSSCRRSGSCWPRCGGWRALHLPPSRAGRHRARPRDGEGLRLHGTRRAPRRLSRGNGPFSRSGAPPQHARDRRARRAGHGAGPRRQPDPPRGRRPAHHHEPERADGALLGSPAPIAVDTIDETTLRVRHGANAFFEAIDPDPRWTLGNFSSFLSDPAHRAALRSLVVTALSTAFGGPHRRFTRLDDRPLRRGGPRRADRPDHHGRRLAAVPRGLCLADAAGVQRHPHAGARLDWTIIGLHGVIWVTAWHVFPLVFLLSYDAFTGADAALGEAPRASRLAGAPHPHRRPAAGDAGRADRPLHGPHLAAFADFGTPKIISLDLN